MITSIALKNLSFIVLETSFPLRHSVKSPFLCYFLAHRYDLLKFLEHILPLLLIWHFQRKGAQKLYT